MIGHSTANGTGHVRPTWPVLLVLLAAALVPTGCVLWFMNAAMGNEQLAMRQRLTEVYQQHLARMRPPIEAYWTAKIRALDAVESMLPTSAVVQLVKSGMVDSAVVYDPSGRLAFPIVSETLPLTDVQPESHWPEAQRMEVELKDYPRAADLYQRIAAQAEVKDHAAMALLAQARCLAQAGQKQQAIHILAKALGSDEYHEARDGSDRLIAPNALMYALELLGKPDSKLGRTIAEDLASRLHRYDGSLMLSSQRLLLMRKLEAATGLSSPMLAAEDLAAAYLGADPPRPTGPGLRQSAPTGVWALLSSNGCILGLFRDTTVRSAMEPLLSAGPPLAGARVVLHHAAEVGPEKPFLSMPVGELMAGWYLSVYLDPSDPLATAANRRIAAYLWTGGLGILLIAALTLAVGGYIGRQMRLTRLKNDLIATVSHELKTPLASMRMLVDTLLDGRCGNPQQTTEYLHLIARENARLSRLIDNFLTFSRMERNKRTFELAPVDVGEIILAAEESVRERFSSPECRLEVAVPDQLPLINGDRDALITVVLNLLDNAYKYTQDKKLVRVRTFAQDRSVTIEVSDNGIGLSRRAARKVFDRFYQVDQTLSRRAGGCGLGLSIVRFIVEAHGGTISVDSRVGQGSTFSIKLPVVQQAEWTDRVEDHASSGR